MPTEIEGSGRKHVSALGYVFTWLALILLTILSFALSLARLPLAPDLILALAIAAIKAGMVGLFFMHLIEQRFANRMTLVIAAVFVAILVALTTADPLTRHTFPQAPQPPGGEAVQEAPGG